MPPTEKPVPAGRTAPGLPRKAAHFVAKIVGPAFRARGLADTRIVTDWPRIVGADLASRSQPEKLVFPAGQRRLGTLRVRAESAHALELQHAEPQIVERINTYFGYGAVARLQLLQGPVARASDPAPPGAPAALPAPDPETAALVARVADEPLRTALTRLARRIAAGASARPAGRGPGQS